MSAGVVIVGAGLAGAETALALRQFGYMGKVCVIGREPWLPYERPPLSKAFLRDAQRSPQSLFIRPQSVYDEHAIDMRTGIEVLSVDREARRLLLSQGNTIDYEKLVLATGGEARMIDVPGATLAGVHTLKSIEDVNALSPQLRAGRRVVIVGGGFVGMEFAATARSFGCPVTVLEAQDRVLARSLSPVVSRHLESVHVSHGVLLRTGAILKRIEGRDRVSGVVLGDGTTLEADLVLVSVGNKPCAELGPSQDVPQGGGVVVDAHGCTSDPDVYAVGDCCASIHEGFDVPMRLESVQQAVAQAKRVAAGIARYPSPPGEVPWFWSDQYDVKLQMAGLPRKGDREIVRGEPASGRFSVVFLAENRMTSIQCVNSPGDFAWGRRLIGLRQPLAVEALGDTSKSMKQIYAGVHESAGQ
jgi:3-phenylpropionate/trans-cinnamate dioxygenase ferredoxin reductase subunit